MGPPASHSWLLPNEFRGSFPSHWNGVRSFWLGLPPARFGNAAGPAAVGAGGEVAHTALYPPSAIRMEPVMKLAASLARKTTLGAISPGCAKRCWGVSSIQ